MDEGLGCRGVGIGYNVGIGCTGKELTNKGVEIGSRDVSSGRS